MQLETRKAKQKVGLLDSTLFHCSCPFASDPSLLNGPRRTFEKRSWQGTTLPVESWPGIRNLTVTNFVLLTSTVFLPAQACLLVRGHNLRRHLGLQIPRALAQRSALSVT